MSRCPPALFLCVAASCAEAALAADVSAYLVLTTDYVWRGVTQSDSHGAVQLGADLSFDSGVYAGVWGSTTDITTAPGRQRDYQLNYYLGYAAGLSESWSVGANVVAYTYPDTRGDVDYDYVEYSLSANYDDHVWLEYSYSPDLYDSGSETHNVELYTEWGLGGQFDIGAGFGYYDVSRFSGSSYNYWQLGVTRTFGRVDVDLRFHDTSRWIPVVSAPDRADSRWVLSLRIVF